MINSAIQIGFSGMRNAYAGMVQSSQQIASAGTQEYGASMPDILENMVSLKENQQLFDASAKVVETSDQMLGTLLDVRV
jgi:flagellar hook-associated protein FlgK